MIKLNESLKGVKLKTKSKSLIFLISAIVFIVVFSSISCLLLLLDFDNKNTKQTLQVSAFSGSGTASDPYLIQNKTDLTTFASNVGKGTTYANTYFKLTTNIDFGGADFSVNKVFSGTFDGNGYKISNYNINCYEYKMAIGSDALGEFCHYFVYGTFVNCNGVIKNLHLDNITCKLSASEFRELSAGSLSYDRFYVYMGGIVGFGNNARIEQCKITNFNVKKGKNWTKYTSGLLSISGIVATGNPIVQNCYVKGVNSEYTLTYASGKYNEQVILALTYARSVEHVQYNSYGGPLEVKTMYYNSEGLQIKGVVVEGIEKMTLSTNESSVVSNSKTSANDVSGLDCSSAGGTTGTAWYYASDYNSGWPMLRVFMKNWKAVSVTANPSSYADLNKTIYIPSDANKTYSGEVTNNGQNAKIVIYGQEITAKPYNGYKFTSWKCNSATSYVVYLEEITYTVTFSTVTIGGVQITPSKSTVQVKHGAGITAVEDAANNVYKYVIKLGHDEIVVEYNLGGNLRKYTIDNFNLNFEKIESAKTITPTFKLKTYGFEFT